MNHVGVPGRHRGDDCGRSRKTRKRDSEVLEKRRQNGRTLSLSFNDFCSFTFRIEYILKIYFSPSRERVIFFFSHNTFCIFSILFEFEGVKYWIPVG